MIKNEQSAGLLKKMRRMTLLVLLVFIIQIIIQTPELKAHFSKENLEKTQKSIIDSSTQIYNDATETVIQKAEEAKQHIEKLYDDNRKDKNSNTDCSELRADRDKCVSDLQYTNL